MRICEPHIGVVDGPPHQISNSTAIATAKRTSKFVPFATCCVDVKKAGWYTMGMVA